MLRALTTFAVLVAFAVSAAPASAVTDGTPNTRTAVRLPTTPPTPPGVQIPYPNS